MTDEFGVKALNIVFHGVNVHIISGSGHTNDNGVPTGLGNLIIGYDEVPSGDLVQNYRGGSHNVVIGMWNMFPGSGFENPIAGEFDGATGEAGFVTRNQNTVYLKYNSVLGGIGNTAGGGQGDIIVGGNANEMRGDCNVILGGQSQGVAGEFNVLLGGHFNGAGDTENTSYAVEIGAIPLTVTPVNPKGN
jgi:hypothetical protein